MANTSTPEAGTAATPGVAPEEFNIHGPVPAALDLGWKMTDLFCDAARRRAAPRRAQNLPTLSDLVPWQKTELALDRVEALLHRLGSAITDAGLTPPVLGSVRDAFKGSHNNAFHAAIYGLHLELLRWLHATDSNLGKAYDLGRSLAYTCRRPKDANTLRHEFGPYRLINLEGWLADLASALPPHAARAVSISLGIWQSSVPEPNAAPRRWQIKDSEQGRVLRHLRRQAKLWRALLTGEKRGRDMLRPNDYIDAASRLFSGTSKLAWGFMWRTGFAVPIVLAAGTAAVFFILTSGGQQGSKIAGAAGAGAAALGLSWKGTKATLGQLAGKLEQPLWHAELDAAIGSAITTLDRKEKVRLISTLDHERREPSLRKLSAEIAPQGPKLLPALDEASARRD